MTRLSSKLLERGGGVDLDFVVYMMTHVDVLSSRISYFLDFSIRLYKDQWFGGRLGSSQESFRKSVTELYSAISRLVLLDILDGHLLGLD